MHNISLLSVPGVGVVDYIRGTGCHNGIGDTAWRDCVARNDDVLAAGNFNQAGRRVADASDCVARENHVLEIGTI